jgi:Mn-containing catalase
VFSSGDLVEDLTHNFFLETGARNNKLKVYEMVNHPAARALTGYLLVRGGVHQIAHARALELLTGAHLTKMFPTPRIPTEKIPESKKHIDKGLHKILYRFSPSDYQELSAVFTGPHPETGEELEVEQGPPEGALPRDLPPQPAVFAPDYAPYRSPRSLNACARTPVPRQAHGRGRGRRRRHHRQGQGQARLALPPPAPGRLRHRRGRPGEMGRRAREPR